jgi:enterochelin esterase-like enzyme
MSVSPLSHHVTDVVARGGYLESTTLGIVLVTLPFLALAGWGAVRIGRRRVPHVPYRSRRWPKVVAASTAGFVVVVAGVAVLVNAYVGYIPTLGALFGTPAVGLARGLDVARSADKGAGATVVHLDIPDRADGIATGSTYVYLPPGYGAPQNAQRRYPVVYLIHGTPGRPQDWIDAGQAPRTMDLLLADHLVGPMIVVSPTASVGYFADDECLNAPGGIQLESYLANTVVDTIDHDFRTGAGRSERAIGGMSSGAFCALNVGLHHPHRFSVILASEPFGDPGSGPLSHLLHGNLPLFQANSPSYYIPKDRFRLPTAVFLDSGGLDGNTTRNATMLAGELATAGQTVAYRQAPGQHHTWREVRVELPYSLIFAWHQLGRLPDGGSDAADTRLFQRFLHDASRQPPEPHNARLDPLYGIRPIGR